MADFGSINPLDLANYLRGIAPYGFRHIENVNEVSLPKGKGWMGALPNQAGGVSTELSSNSNNLSYPLLVPTLTSQEVAHLLANKEPTEEIYKKAESWASYRQNQGKSPFISPVGEMRWGEPK